MLNHSLYPSVTALLFYYPGRLLTGNFGTIPLSISFEYRREDTGHEIARSDARKCGATSNLSRDSLHEFFTVSMSGEKQKQIFILIFECKIRFSIRLFKECVCPISVPNGISVILHMM